MLRRLRYRFLLNPHAMSFLKLPRRALRLPFNLVPGPIDPPWPGMLGSNDQHPIWMIAHRIAVGCCDMITTRPPPHLYRQHRSDPSHAPHPPTHTETGVYVGGGGGRGANVEKSGNDERTEREGHF